MKKVNKVSNDSGGGGSYSRYPNIPPEVGGQLYIIYYILYMIYYNTYIIHI